MQLITRPLAAAWFLCAAIDMAAAQTPGGSTSAVPSQHPAEAGQGSSGASSGNGGQAPQSGSSGAPGSLSRELNRSGGVIRPPAIHDPGVVSPPNQGVSRTPVIPPPGSPGGNPNVQPK